jgi:hypothetical protein
VAVIEQADIRRLFEGLVEELARRDPDRLRAGFDVAELYEDLIPYRTHRKALGFASHQDYEAAVLGLLAGLGGYASVEPGQARESLAAEAASASPDPSLFHEFADVRVRLNDARVREVLSGDAVYAPPVPEPAAPPPPTDSLSRPGLPFLLAGADGGPEATSPTPTGQRGAPACCTGCQAELPTDRAVVYCPFCGCAVGAGRCARCGDVLRPEWRFCPRCGHRHPR